MKPDPKLYWVLIITLFFRMSVSSVAQSGGLKEQIVNFLMETQINCPPDHSDAPYNGLWWSEIRNARSSVFFGKKGQTARDANCFSTAMIHVLLAEMQADHPELEEMQSTLNASLQGINRFKINQHFCFFPVIQPPDPLVKRGEDRFYPQGIRGASHYPYPSVLINRAFHIYSDADDTALAFYANYLTDSEYGRSQGDTLLALLNQYRDLPGSGRNLWNILRGHGRSTGAFLTWLPDNPDKSYHHLIPRPGKPYIPYGVNDVDCVLNANLLGILSAMEVEPSDEMLASAGWIMDVIRRNKCRTCAVYYPASNSLLHAVVQAFYRGADYFEPILPLVLELLLDGMQDEGGWTDRIPGNEHYATLLGVSSLMMLDIHLEEDLSEFIRKGSSHLRSFVVVQDDQAWMPGGAIFSAGSVFKRCHYWSCEAYTSALYLQILLLGDSYLIDSLPTTAGL